MTFPAHVKTIFWDFDSRDLDAKKHGDFIISRVAEKGGESDIIWLRKIFPLAKIRRAVRTSRNVSKKTKNFWLNIL